MSFLSFLIAIPLCVTACTSLDIPGNLQAVTCDSIHRFELGKESWHSLKNMKSAKVVPAMATLDVSGNYF